MKLKHMVIGIAAALAMGWAASAQAFDLGGDFANWDPDDWDVADDYEPEFVKATAYLDFGDWATGEMEFTSIRDERVSDEWVTSVSTYIDGDTYGAAPDGNAVYRGTAHGFNKDDGSQHYGSAIVQYRLSTNIINAMMKVGDERLGWRNVAVRENGTFDGGTYALHSIRGAFYGEKEVEGVAGTFSTSTYDGVFGAD